MYAVSFRVAAGVLFLCIGFIASADETEKPDLRRMKYNHPGLVVDLGVGLWGWPLPMDYDRDGDLDLIVSCSDVPCNGLYFFENPGGEAKLPVFRPAVRLGDGISNVAISHVDDRPHVFSPAHEHAAFLKGEPSTKERLYPRHELGAPSGRIRANQWGMVDYDGDGAVDLVAGLGFWSDYGWDNAYDEQGRWTRGPLHGHVFVMRNEGTTAKPAYSDPVQVTAGGKPVDVFGMPSPNFADFDGDGDLDLLCGDFLDGFTYFQNVGDRAKPEYDAGRELARDGRTINMHLCMIVVAAIDWDRDGDVDLVVGQEDGRVAFVEHTGQVFEGMPVFEDPTFFQQEAKHVKFGALATPVGFDWDGDGDEDLVCGNTAGEIGFIENLNGGNPPKWAAPKRLEAEGRPIRIMAGPNGSIQGPAEAKWGYTSISVADWDHDQLPDIIANSIWGKVVWFSNIGTRTAPQLAAAQPIQVHWRGEPSKPDWNWWDPENDELATQWRTTPCVVDWNKDGLNDLVMLDHEGYLALFQRERSGDKLIMLPGKRIFRDGRQSESDPVDPLHLSGGDAGRSGRRKLCIVDWDADGKLDLLINSENVNLMQQTSFDDGFHTFEDRGTLSRRRLAGHTTSPTTVDWDGDGRRELLVGAEDGFFYHE
jgi:hypothetical protein